MADLSRFKSETRTRLEFSVYDPGALSHGNTSLLEGLRFISEQKPMGVDCVSVRSHSRQRNGNRQLTQQPMFKISNDVRKTETQDGLILLDIHHGQMFCLNLVGSKILELLARGYDETCIAEEISKSYGVARDIASGDVREFLNALYRHHILQPQRPNGSI